MRYVITLERIGFSATLGADLNLSNTTLYRLISASDTPSKQKISSSKVTGGAPPCSASSFLSADQHHIGSHTGFLTIVEIEFM